MFNLTVLACSSLYLAVFIPQACIVKGFIASRQVSPAKGQSERLLIPVWIAVCVLVCLCLSLHYLFFYCEIVPGSVLSDISTPTQIQWMLAWRTSAFMLLLPPLVHSSESSLNPFLLGTCTSTSLELQVGETKEKRAKREMKRGNKRPSRIVAVGEKAGIV